MWSIMGPKGGTNSCLLFNFAINAVILDLLVCCANFCLESVSFKTSTFLATLSLTEYSHECQVLLAFSPKVPLQTFANDEKNVALFPSSPLRKAIIFMSFGSSAMWNSTLMVTSPSCPLYLHGKTVCSIL